MLLNHWTIRIFYDLKGDDNCPAEVNSNVDYQRANIQINEEVFANEWKEYGDKVAKRICYHEVTHVLLARLHTIATLRYLSRNEMTEANESLTDQITKIVLQED